MVRRITLFSAVALALFLTGSPRAQQTQSPATQDGLPQEKRTEGWRQDRRSGRHRMQLSQLEGELALTDAQREQLRALHERRLESMKTQREELFQLGEKRRAGTLTPADTERAQALYKELQASRENVEREMQNILTPEQQEKLKELKTERKTNREERMRHRREFKDAPPN